MATRVWQGNGVAPVANVWTVTVVASGSGGDRLGVTVNGKTLYYTSAGGSTSASATGLQAVLAASAIPEFAEYAWTVLAAVVTATARTAGVPGVLAQYETGTANVTVAETVAATGPNFASAAANWSGGAVPVDGDAVVFERSAVSCLYGLTAFAGVTPASIAVRKSFTGAVGLPAVNAGVGGTVLPGGGGGYPEYRARFLQFAGNPPATIGDGEGAGSPRINLEVGTGSCVVTVFGTGPASAAGPALSLINSGTGNTLNVNNGSVGAATETGQSAQFTTTRVAAGAVWVGAGCAAVNVAHQGGDVDCDATLSGALTMGRDAGRHAYRGGDLTATVYGGRLVYQSGGTLAVTADGSKAVVDLSKDVRPKTLSGSFDDGAALIDPAGTFAGEPTFDDASAKASSLGRGFKVKR